MGSQMSLLSPGQNDSHDERCDLVICKVKLSASLEMTAARLAEKECQVDIEQ